MEIEPYQMFEIRWGQFFRARRAVACSTGTAALHLALTALGIGPGDEVLVPEFTMVACANAVSYTGATPVFVDCGDDLNMDPSLIKQKITSKTKAIMPVHIYGKPCDMDPIMKIARIYGLYVVEDAAEAPGAMYKGKAVGTIGDIGCFSHYKNKIIAAEEGGSCLTNNPKLADKMESLRSHCFDRDHTFLHSNIGFNYRMANSQASVLLMQNWGQLIAERQKPDGSVVWVYPFVYKTRKERDKEYERYREEGANPRLFFKPMSMQPMYFGDYKKLKAYDYAKRGLYLPYEKRR